MKTGAPKRFFRLAYSNVVNSSKRSLLHQVRDGMAFCELGAALSHLGYEFGTTVHLYEEDPRPLSDLPPTRPGDCFVLTTRPPLDDVSRKPAGDAGTAVPADGAERKTDEERANPHRRVVPRNCGELETAYFEVLREYFRFCDRATVSLGDRAGRLLPEEFAAYRSVGFSLYTQDAITEFRLGDRVVRPRGRDRWTLVFFIRARRLPGLNCGMIASFGMSGFSTLAWNRVVRVRHPEWIETRRFVMARMCVSGLPPSPEPLTPAFADDERIVRVEVLAEEPLRG